MSVHQTASTVAGGVVGTAGLSFPLWNDAVAILTGVNQWVIAIGGLMVLALTIRKLLLENRLASIRLREHEKGK